MAAYGALVSLANVLEHALHPGRRWIFLDRKEIQSLQQKVCSLVDILEDISHRCSKLEADGLESAITAASYSAEDIIESFVLDQKLARSQFHLKRNFTRFSQDIQKVIEDMDSIEKQLMEIKQKMGVVKDQQHVNSLPAAGLSRSAPSSKNTMVGFDDYLIQIMERLTEQRSKLQMISIVGMGGIGKTTLARNIYDNPVIAQYFHVRAWITISQEYTVREILLALLRDVKFFSNNCKQECNENLAADKMSQTSTDEQLGEQIYKGLCGKRYLIVMDDMWSTEPWNEVRMFFPDNCNESRIMITTRLSNVADCFGSSHKMDFLDEDKSWNLFCEKVFPQEGCPLEFKEIGKKIVKSCRGLPLAIVVIGGLLAKSNRTIKYWNYVAENLNSIINSEKEDHCFKILSLSYSHLPIHLKPCFLYMASFAEHREIRVSRLIKLWVAEGFLKPLGVKSLEDIAIEHIKDLIDRNLILVGKQGTTGEIKSCIMHDLLRDLCLREAHKENFLCVISLSSLDIPPNRESKRRLCINRSTTEHWDSSHRRSVKKIIINSITRRIFDFQRQSVSLARTLLCDFEWVSTWLVSSSRLLRVLDVADKYSVEKIMQLVNSRYLGFKHNCDFTSSISQFWNLQTLIVRPVQFTFPTILPSEIWEMPQLRHIEFNEVVLPDPPPQVARQNSYNLENLQTIFTIRNFRCTEEVYKRVPNVKKIKIVYMDLENGVDWSYYCPSNLVHLHKLESLTCRTYFCDKMSAGNIAFPTSLKKLTLRGCRLPWEDITIVGSLPSLEVLKLEFYAFEGPEWNVIEGEFVRLKFLLIGETDLMHWRADSTHFPSLEQLVLQDSELQEISLGLAEVPLLRFIQLTRCKDSVVTSAKLILEERESLGNEGLQVEVRTKNGAVLILASEYLNEEDIEP